MKEARKKWYQKGSAMVMAMIVLVNALVIVASISMISVAERKMSGKFKSSTPAFQAADSGVEWAMKKIQDNPGSKKISDIFGTPGADGAFSCGAIGVECKVVLLDAEGNPVGSADSLSEIATIRSIGSAGTGDNVTNRAVETAVAAGPTLNKMCKVWSAGTDKYEEYMPVPDSWTKNDCKAFAGSAVWSNDNYWDVCCYTSSSFICGGGTPCQANTSCVASTPSSNCGW